MEKTLNKVIMEGIVGSDPESRINTSGEELISFILGTEETILDKTKVIWHNIVVFKSALRLFVKNHVRRGNNLHIEGMLYSRKEISRLGPKVTSEVLLCAHEHRIDFVTPITTPTVPIKSRARGSRRSR